MGTNIFSCTSCTVDLIDHDQDWSRVSDHSACFQSRTYPVVNYASRSGVTMNWLLTAALSQESNVKVYLALISMTAYPA